MSFSIQQLCCKRNAKIRAADSDGGHFFDEIESGQAKEKKMIGRKKERERERKRKR